MRRRVEESRTHSSTRVTNNQQTKVPSIRLLTEDEVKAAVKSVLEDKGYEVAVAWGHSRGVDLDARRGNDRLLIEAKGDALSPQIQGNYFLGALGELDQRMSDPKAEYGLALPDNPRFRGLMERLPDLAADRLRLYAFLVDIRADMWAVSWLSWDDTHRLG